MLAVFIRSEKYPLYLLPFFSPAPLHKKRKFNLTAKILAILLFLLSYIGSTIDFLCLVFIMSSCFIYRLCTSLVLMLMAFLDSDSRICESFTAEFHFGLFVRSFVLSCSIVRLQFKLKMFLFPFIHCDWSIFRLNNRIIFARICLFYSTWCWIMRKLLVFLFFFFFLLSSQARSPPSDTSNDTL